MFKYHTLIAVLPSAICEVAKSLCVVLIILLHSQMCCKRKLVKRRIKVPVCTVRQGFLKKTGSLKPQTATSSTKSAVSQTVRANSIFIEGYACQMTLSYFNFFFRNFFPEVEQTDDSEEKKKGNQEG
ncbi:unnamed protein product [Brugia pahangi]|uniref:Secreted protein n=1 Tax=Brugia pahangi TaxID=6280 RepID=A0A0N4T2U8_BRUPA|nr:unnamed protein product [Brugia pahangi]